MKNKISKETKYHYVKRYLEGESPTVLGREINYKVKSPKDIIFRWHRLYLKGDVMALEDKKGRKSKIRKSKKSKFDPDKMEGDELLNYVKIMEETIKLYDDFLKKKMRNRFLYSFFLIMSEKFNRSITGLCKFYGVSTLGYYDGVKNPQFSNNYNGKGLNIIKNEYELHNGIYGAERIGGSLTAKNELTICLSAIKISKILRTKS